MNFIIIPFGDLSTSLDNIIYSFPFPLVHFDFHLLGGNPYVNLSVLYIAADIFAFVIVALLFFMELSF